MRARFAAPLLVLVLVAGCGGKSGPAQTQVVPSTPTGTVWGEVVDAAGQAPIAGAKVSLAIAGAAKTTKTGKDGSFTFASVPAGGQAAVTVSMTGYTGATIPFAIPATTGNFPSDGIGAYVGPIALFPATGTAQVQVIGYDGALIDKAKVTAWVPAAYADLGNGQTRGVVSTSGVTAKGTVALKGLPDFATLMGYTTSPVTFTVGPVDTNGDGVPEYLGTSVAVPPSTLLAEDGRVTVTLPPPGQGSSFVPISSNVGSIFTGGLARYGTSILAADDPVRVVFNQPVAPGTVVANLFDETGQAITASAAVRQGNVVEVTPHSAFAAGGDYFVTLRAQAAGTTSGQYQAMVAGWFYIPAGNTQPAVKSYAFTDRNNDGFLDAGDQVTLVLDRAVGNDGTRLPISFYINADLDGSGTVGDALGEFGSHQPIKLTPVAPPVGPAPGLVRTYTGYLPYVAPAKPTGSPYQFGPTTTVAYVLDFPNSPGIYDAEGQPLQATQGQFKVSFK